MKFVDRGYSPGPTRRQSQLGNRSVHLGPRASFHLTRLSGTHLVLLGLAISILTSLVVLASNGASAVGGRASHAPAVAAIGQTLVLLIIAGDLAVMVLVAYAVWSGRRRGKGTDENDRSPCQPAVHWIWKVAAVALPLIFLLGLVLAVHALPAHLHPPPAIGVPSGRLPPGSRPTAGIPSANAPGFITPVLLAAAAITVTLLIIGFSTPLGKTALRVGVRPAVARSIASRFGTLTLMNRKQELQDAG